jgi:outer membrane receptor protein involved in Fe transport
LLTFAALVHRLVTLAAVCALLCCSARLVRADDVADEAEIQFELGTQRYQAADYKTALAHFLASNRLAKNRNVLFNIARCYEQLGELSEAHRYYSGAIDGEEDPAARSLIGQALARITPLVALLKVVTDPPGAHIFLDRKDLGERGTAPQSMAVAPATYRVIASLEGYEDATSDPIETSVGTERVVGMRLKRIVGTLHVPGPAGASVRLDSDSAPACIAPCDVRGAPGQHTLIVQRPGYLTTRVPVLIEEDKTSLIRTPLEPETGSLVINTDEHGAAISIDGFARGFTPAVLTPPVGLHRVQVTLSGFQPIEQDVMIRLGEEQRLDLELVPSDSVEAASRMLETVAEAPASVSIISASELRAMRYPTLAEAMRGVRGAFVSDDRAAVTLGFRGLARAGSYGNRVLVTLDGVPLNDDWLWASSAGYDLRSDLDDIDRIEIVRGPGSVVYGTSAFSGVVNLLTRYKDVPSEREVGVSVAADGVARARARITQRFGQHSGLWTSFALGSAEGRDYFFSEFVGDGPPEIAGHARGLDDARFGSVTGRWWWRDFSLAWSANHHDKQLPTGQLGTVFGDPRTHQVDTRALLEARFEPKLGRYVTSLSRVHGDLYRHRGYFAVTAEEGSRDIHRYDSAWLGAEQRFVITPLPQLSVSVGAEGQLHPRAKQQSATDTFGVYFEDERDFGVAALYASVDARPHEWMKLSAGGRLDYYSTFGTSINPRLAAIFEPYPGGNLKLLAAKAFRAPSTYELYYTARGQQPNPGLEPEDIYSAEIEYSHRASTNVVVTGALFCNYTKDLIALEPGPLLANDTPTLQFRNLTTPIGTMGAELEVRRDWKQGWMLGASYSYQHSEYLRGNKLKDLIQMRSSPEYREVPNSPEHLASIKGAAPLWSRALSLMSRLSLEGPRYDSDDSTASATEQTRTETALLWDVVLSGKEQRYGLDYSLGVYNAFDSRAGYPVSSEFRQRSIPITGRSLLLALGLTF